MAAPCDEENGIRLSVTVSEVLAVKRRSKGRCRLRICGGGVLEATANDSADRCGDIRVHRQRQSLSRDLGSDPQR